MQFDLEKATPFSVAAEEFIALLQDPKRFMIASGGTEEDSIKYDETQDVYEGTSKDSIPMLSKPRYTSKVEKTAKGIKCTVNAGFGITSVHTWTVESISEQECVGTEHVTVTASAMTYYPVKLTFPGAQQRSHKSLQEYLS